MNYFLDFYTNMICQKQKYFKKSYLRDKIVVAQTFTYWTL